jgi:hypothetical protein
VALRVCVGETLTGGTGDDEFDVAWSREGAGAAASDDVVEEVVDRSEIEFGIFVIKISSVGMNCVDVDVDSPSCQLCEIPSVNHL